MRDLQRIVKVVTKSGVQKKLNRCWKDKEDLGDEEIKTAFKLSL